MHFHHIVGQIIYEFAAVFGFGADHNTNSCSFIASI